MKKLWTGIKSLVKIKQKSIVQISHLYQNGEFTKDLKSIANVFNNFFVKIGKHIDNDIPYCGTSPKRFLKNCVCISLYLEPVTDSEIISIIESLNPTYIHTLFDTLCVYSLFEIYKIQDHVKNCKIPS